MKMASLYERNRDWYVQPMSQTTSGLWVASRPLVRIDSYASRESKGQAALDALNASRLSVPLPSDPNGLFDPILEIAQARSYESFMKHARHIQLTLESDRLTVIPYEKARKPRGTLLGIPEKTIELAAGATPEEIGAAMEEALSRCK
jgi:hypothetical protein